MKAPLATEIFEPNTLEEALGILAKKGTDALIMAGGTDLVVKLKDGIITTDSILDIYQLPLSYIKGSLQDGFKIGATTTATDIVKSPVLNRDLPVLVDAAKHLGGPQTQELATIGGNVCNASPAGNLINVLYALDARVKMVGPKSGREMAITDFFKGPGKTVLGPSEIVTEIVIPGIPSDYGAEYIKYTLRKEMDIAMVGAAVFLIPDADKVKKIRIALGAVGPTAILARKAQAVLEGKAYTPELVEEAAKTAVEEGSYIDDVRASAAYRRTITGVIVKKAITKAWSMAKGGK